ncbi:hypothetical protein KM043_016190 [Ampulex compressa]|nr:hypothetical protein KM043_016190 [Ampulex compressa]
MPENLSTRTDLNRAGESASASRILSRQVLVPLTDRLCQALHASSCPTSAVRNKEDVKTVGPPLPLGQGREPENTPIGVKEVDAGVAREDNRAELDPQEAPVIAEWPRSIHHNWAHGTYGPCAPPQRLKNYICTRTTYTQTSSSHLTLEVEDAEFKEIRNEKSYDFLEQKKSSTFWSAEEDPTPQWLIEKALGRENEISHLSNEKERLVLAQENSQKDVNHKIEIELIKKYEESLEQKISNVKAVYEEKIKLMIAKINTLECHNSEYSTAIKVM